MDNRDHEAEWRHLWAWARSVSVISDLPEALDWNEDAERLEKRMEDRAVVFTVEVVRGVRRREVATIALDIYAGGRVAEEIQVPAAVSARALAIGRGEA